ncbi:MAG: glucosaminidase domain-containing protein [Lachnospiraceae bacterium]|nr:glucosaminidase domain-containing protein [Lachnospiraceae bacterium]
MTASKLIMTARSYIGVAEGSAAHKAIIDMYNTIKPLPRGYRVTYMDAWCAVFVSFCALMSGVTLPLECGCQEMYKAFSDKRSRVATPGLGWVIFYDWQGDGHTEHVGIVESIKDGLITVIEGNHNDRVGRRQIRVGDPSIYGYGVPKFKEESMTEKQWIETVAPAAVFCARKYGYPASALIGQTCQETGYGKTSLVRVWNVIGMKATLLPYKSPTWSGKAVIKGTWEEVDGQRTDKDDAFREYASIQDCLEDYCTFMRDGQSSPGVYKYRHILEWGDPERVLRYITGRYATDHTYADKVLDIIHKHGLTKFDEEARKVIVTRTKFLEGIFKTAEEAQKNGWVWGNSTTWPPCLDGFISCDRLVSRTLARDFGIEQKRGGWNSAELAQNLTRFGFTKITDRKKIKPGAVVMIGKGADQTYHTMVVERYDPSTDRCDKVDLGHDDRIKVGGRFKNVPLVEWDDRFFSMAFNPTDDPTPKKTPKDLVKEGQEALNKFFGMKLKIDGDRGKLTETAFVKAFQTALNRDYYGDGPMPVNGKLTQLTRAGLGTHYVEYDELQGLVTIVETGMLLAGEDPGGVEYPGHYGTNLQACTGKVRMTSDDIWKLFRPELLKD